MDELSKLLEQLELTKEIISYGKNYEASPSFKSVREAPMMLEEIMNLINEDPDSISGNDLCEFILALKNMSERIKPVYIRMMLYKEARENANK